MRVPGSISGTDKVYVATWAALPAVQAHNQSIHRDIHQNVGQTTDRINGTVALPAMGTGFGGVPFSEAARQMAAAHRHHLEPPHRLNWDGVTDRQKAICYDGIRQVAR